jgi:hypothetical protein
MNAAMVGLVKNCPHTFLCSSSVCSRYVSARVEVEARAADERVIGESLYEEKGATGKTANASVD